MSQYLPTAPRESVFGIPRLDEYAIYTPIGIMLILSLQFQTLPLQIPIQTLPLTTVIALIALPFVVWRIPKSPLLAAVTLFAGFAFLHSVVALFIDVAAGFPETRFIAWLRQFVALLAGVVTFLVFRQTLRYLSLEKVFFYILVGSIPALVLSLLNILWGALNVGWAGTAVETIRDFISPMGYTSPLRASGFSVEPAAFATILVTVVLPAIFVLLFHRQHVMFTLCVLGMTVVVFIWTFSISGLLLLFVFLLSAIVFGPARKGITAVVVVVLVLVGVTVTMFPSNQILRHARSIAIGQSNLSVNDRYYGVVGPFIRAVDSYTIIGYGLGGVSAHFDDVVPPKVQREILAAKWKDYPTISSLFGRTFAETGALGLSLFLLVIALSFWQLWKLIRLSEHHSSRIAYGAIRLALIVIYASMFVSIGPYHTPYFWFWIAVVDTHYLLLLEGRVRSKTSMASQQGER